VTQRIRNGSVAALVAGFVFAGLLSTQAAHHSFAMYDQSIRKTMTGTLVRFILGASHSQFIFEAIEPDGKPAVDKDGKPVKWQVELGSAAAIARQGVTVKTFTPGTVLTVTFFPQRDGRNQGAIAGELILCGTTLPAGGCTSATGQVMKPPAN
jgi:hypothetical protein